MRQMGVQSRRFLGMMTRKAYDDLEFCVNSAANGVKKDVGSKIIDSRVKMKKVMLCDNVLNIIVSNDRCTKPVAYLEQLV